MGNGKWAIERREAALLLVLVAGLAIAVLGFLPWISYHWLTPSCPTCGSGVYLTDYADAGNDVRGVTGFGDGLVIAGFGLLISALALVALRFREKAVPVMVAVAGQASVVLVISLQDALTTWTSITRTEPLPTGTWYPRLISFESSVGLALYAEIALASAVVLSVLIFLAASIRCRRLRRLLERRDRAWA